MNISRATAREAVGDVLSKLGWRFEMTDPDTVRAGPVTYISLGDNLVVMFSRLHYDHAMRRIAELPQRHRGKSNDKSNETEEPTVQAFKAKSS